MIRPPKWLIITVVSVLAAVVVVAVSYATIRHFFPTKFEEESFEDSTPPKEVIKLVTERLQNTFNDDEILSIEPTDTAPYWPVENSLFYVNYTGEDAEGIDINYEYSGLVTSEEVAQQRTAIVAAIAESLINQGFSKLADEGYGDRTDVYVDGYNICTMDVSVAASTPPPLSLRCGSVAQYTGELDSYKSSRSFADAYTNAGKTVIKGDLFLAQSDKPSATPNYSKAEVNLVNLHGDGGVTLLFYKKGSGAWQYFADTQITLPCSQYSTADSRAAFAGDPCYDTVTQTTTTVKQ